MNEHHCDPQIALDISDTPITEIRVLQILRCYLHQEGMPAVHQAMAQEFGDCADCLRQAFFVALGMAADAVAQFGGTPDEKAQACDLMMMAVEVQAAAKNPDNS